MLEVEGLVEIRTSEVGPITGGEHQFSICDLPQQEVADPGFATGADEEFGIRAVQPYSDARQWFVR